MFDCECIKLMQMASVGSAQNTLLFNKETNNICEISVKYGIFAKICCKIFTFFSTVNRLCPISYRWFNHDHHEYKRMRESTDVLTMTSRLQWSRCMLMCQWTGLWAFRTSTTCLTDDVRDLDDKLTSTLGNVSSPRAPSTADNSSMMWTTLEQTHRQ